MFRLWPSLFIDSFILDIISSLNHRCLVFQWLLLRETEKRYTHWKVDYDLWPEQELQLKYHCRVYMMPIMNGHHVYPGTIEGKVENGKILPPKVSHKKKIHIFWNFDTNFFWQTTNTSEVSNLEGQVHSLPITPPFDLRKLVQTWPDVRYLKIHK